jgi:Spy/CpxP family protein refolding chaperone
MSRPLLTCLRLALAALLTAAATQPAAAQAHDPVCNPGYSVGFFNGVDTTRDTAQQGLEALRSCGSNESV